MPSTRCSFQLLTWIPTKTPSTTMTKSMKIAVHSCRPKCWITRRKSMFFLAESSLG